METRDVAVPPCTSEVQMVEPSLVRQIRSLSDHGWGTKRIARALAVSRNTVKRYLRGGTAAEAQRRPKAWKLDATTRSVAVELFETTAEGNAVVVADLLAEVGVTASVRTVQRAVAGRRQAQQAAEVATVRFETAPGHQMQIDFGEKWVVIAGGRVKVHLLTAVLGYSRRIFVKPFLSERQDDWREGIAEAFRHFGGVPQTLLCDNARALVSDRDRVSDEVRFNPAFLHFCRDWEVTPRACRPYRARTKGKVESGVKYVKRNALAGREFESFAALEAHLAKWSARVDGRVHKTTHDKPCERFEVLERAALRALPEHRLRAREQRLVRRVSHESLVDVDTVRYSVPHRLVRDRVEVHIDADTVRIFHGSVVVAQHVRSREPHARVIDPAHFEGLWRRPAATSSTPPATGLSALGRSLVDYERIVGGGR
jgi:transposase